MTQVNQNLTHELSSERYLCRFRLKHQRETQDFIFGGREFQMDAPKNERLLVNKLILGLGKYVYSSSWCSGTWKNERVVLGSLGHRYQFIHQHFVVVEKLFLTG